MSSLYPKECFSCVRQQTFAVQPELFLADPRKGEDPAKIYGLFSRLGFTILGKPEGGKREFAASNVSLSAFEEIRQLSLEAHQMNTSMLYSPAAASTPAPASAGANAGNECQSPAYTVTFNMGKLKGKTPAQVCLEYGDDAYEILNTQYNFLYDNQEKYPGNKRLMEAILDASKLHAAGKIKATAAATVTVPEQVKPSIMIYSVMHGNPHKEHPTIRGNFYCHDTKIVWNVGNNYPVSVTIENYYAPIRTDDLGKINVEVSKKLADTVKHLEFKLTGAEWLHCLAMIEKSMTRFEMVHAREIEIAIATCDKENRDAANAASRAM